MKKLALLVIILCLTACSHNSTPEMTPDPSLPEVTPAANPSFPATIVTRDVPDEVQFDWDEAMRNIYICGRKIRFPKNAEDLLTQLGKGFSVKIELIESNDRYRLILFYKGKRTPVAFASRYAPTIEDKPTMQSDICYIFLGEESSDDDDVWKPSSKKFGLNGLYDFSLGAQKTQNDFMRFWGEESYFSSDSGWDTCSMHYGSLFRTPWQIWFYSSNTDGDIRYIRIRKSWLSVPNSPEPTEKE